MLGDGAVGKTSIANRLVDDQFNQSYKQTIGLDFFLKEITLPGDVKVVSERSCYLFLCYCVSIMFGLS